MSCVRRWPTGEGDTFETCIRAEYDQELGGRLSYIGCLFVLENRFRSPKGRVHMWSTTSRSCSSGGARHPRTAARLRVLPLGALQAHDVLPHVVPDALVDGTWRQVRHLIVPFHE